MIEPGYSDALRVLRDAAGGDLQHVIVAACEPIPAWDPIVYLGDFSGEELFPLAPGEATEVVAGSMAGRAFSTGQPVTSERDDGIRVWVPVTEQASRTGVLAVTTPDEAPETIERVELLGVFAGLVIAAAARVSDIPYIRRQGREMSLPAGMQWDLLPPLNTRTPGATIAGLLEPAYDIAGDAFDYAIGGDRLDFAIIDGMGHGIASTLLTGLAVGAYRHARRARRLDRGHPRGHRPGPHQQLRRRFVRHRRRRQAGVRAPAGWNGRAPGIRRRCCCAGARSSPSWPTSRSCPSGCAGGPS